MDYSEFNLVINKYIKQFANDALSFYPHDLQSVLSTTAWQAGIDDRGEEIGELDLRGAMMIINNASSSILSAYPELSDDNIYNHLRDEVRHRLDLIDAQKPLTELSDDAIMAELSRRLSSHEDNEGVTVDTLRHLISDVTEDVVPTARKAFSL